MAKKKKAAVKKKAAKTTASGPVSPPMSEDELCASAVVTWGGEGLRGICEYRDADSRYFISEVVVTVGEPPTRERTTVEEDARRMLHRCRDLFVEGDYSEMPYLRVVGKVVEVLTVHRRSSRKKDFCTTGDVFGVFLTEIPQHSPYAPEDYRLARPTRRGNEFNLSKDPAKTMFSDRLKKLKDGNWLTPAGTTRSGGERGYKLTEEARLLFDGWPEVEGLQNVPPATE